MRQFFVRLLLFTSLLCFVFLVMLLYLRFRPNHLAFQGPVFTRQLSETFHENPTMITIPSIGVKLPVFPSEITGTTWQTSDRGVSYLDSSPFPGSKGNAIFYGHNWPNILGPLYKIRVGDTIAISYGDGSTVSFVVESITIVSPDQIKILQNSKDRRLTIYTCTGFLDSKRFVVTAIKT